MNHFEKTWTSSLFSVEHYVGLISIAIYLIMSINLYKKETKKIAHNKKLIYILICFSIIWLIWFPYTIIDSLYYDFNLPVSKFYSFYIFFTALTYGIGFIGFRLNTQETIKRNFEKNSEAKELAKTITHKMKIEKYYLDPNVNINSFAVKMNLHPNKVSAVINNMMGYSFRDFINMHRVEEFKYLAKTYDSKSKTILSLALDAGFNSKASFNRAFKKFCNMSPIEYLEKNQKI
ncbi:AraC family transcriptional regulator [uncultured Psychroserpens sp.]|uniref:helix-turn-helix domain-containing protein n=1 Tax=uncultured Psychroserpens sp. TaxID=255436 RepID=UPI0026314D0B|nr:helix-turn-helix domain-containing protein [uncultured Psychroserpens sp.]